MQNASSHSRPSWFQRLYTRVCAHAASPHAPAWLAFLTFCEASFFPLPPETLLIPMVLARREYAWRYAFICTVFSVFGGLLGWLIGAMLLDLIARPIVHFYHAEHTLISLQEKFRQWGIWFILLKGLTPIPFKLVTIASGMAHFALLPFIIACTVTRGLRFFLVAGLLKQFGPSIEKFIETRLPLVMGAAAIVFISGFLLLHYL